MTSGIISDEERREQDRQRLNAAVKERFGAAFAHHAPMCPVCILRGPRACDIGRVLQACAENGTETRKEHVK